MGLIYQGSLAFSSGNGDRNNFAGTLLAENLINGIIGAVVAIWLLELIRVGGRIWLQKEAMGGGDPKLAAMLGMWLGWQNILLTVLVASAIGTLIGAIAFATKILGKQQPVPFGPFLALGGALSLFFGKQIISTYLTWFGLI